MIQPVESDVSEDPPAILDVVTDSGPQTGEDATDTETPPVSCDWLAEPAAPPEQSGVVYLSHFDSTDLQIYRVDGEEPYSDGSVELGALTHSLAMDHQRDLLVVALDLIGEVRLYQASRPADPDTPVAPPQITGTIVFPTDYPNYVAVDAHRQRLYVVAASFEADVPTDKDLLYIYDIADPSLPADLSAGGQLVDAAMGIDVDVAAGLVVMPGFMSGSFSLHDGTDGTAPLLGGTPIDLPSLYPEEGDETMQLRSLRFNPNYGRLLGARSQGALSEVMAFVYGTVVGRAAEPCPERPDHDSFHPTSDFFDLSDEDPDRPTLVETFDVIPDPTTGNSFLVANVVVDSVETSVIIPQGLDLNPGPACEHWEATEGLSMGCLLRGHEGSVPTSYETTYGASCLDSTHGVFVTSSYDTEGAEPGRLHLFRYEPDLTMEPWLPAGGDSLPTGVLPVSAVCH